MDRATTHRRALLLAAGALVAAVIAGGTAREGRAGDARVAVDATTFVAGLLAGDPAVCPGMTDRLVKTFAAFAGGGSCPKAMSNIRASNREAAEKDAVVSLDAAVKAAEEAMSANIDRLDYKAAWVGKHFSVKALAAEIRGTVTELGPLRVKLGRGPLAARGTPKNLIVIDIARTTPKTLTLYAESSAGAIWVGITPALGKPRFIRTKVRGIGSVAPLPTPLTETIDGIPATGSSYVLARIARGSFLDSLDLGFSEGGATDALFVRTPDGRFDQLLDGLELLPQPASTPGTDPTGFTAAVASALTTGDGAAWCALFHPDFFTYLKGTPTDCTSEPPLVVTETTPAGLVAPTADGTILRAFTTTDPKAASQPPFQLATYFLARSVVGGYRMTGYFIDVSELIEKLGGDTIL